MNDKLPSILNEDNYRKLADWLADDLSAEPPFCESFINTLNYLYVNRREKTREPRPLPPFRMPLQNFYAAGQKPEPEKQETKQPAPRLPRQEEHTYPGDGTIPFENAQGFRESGLDSLDVARSVAWHYQQLDRELTGGKPLSMSLLQTTLFRIYGTYLAQKGIRITVEHPQMWQYGPVFARVYAKMKNNIFADDATRADILKKIGAQMDEFIGRIIRINTEQKTKLSDTYSSPSSPWGQCNKIHGDKWSIELDDTTIAHWFRKNLEKSK